MKHFFALPALLRPALVLALQHSFSVNDDILAFPQYEVKFSDAYLSDIHAQSRLLTNNPARGDPDVQAPGNDEEAPSHIQPYQPQPHAYPSDGPQKDKQRYEYELMTLGQDRYLCSLPILPKPSSSSPSSSDQPPANDTLTKAAASAELARANARGWELLSGMQGNCVYFISGWWSYSFCYEKEVRQFHQLPPGHGVPVWPPVEDPGVGGFSLGQYRALDNKGGKEGDARAEDERADWEGEGTVATSQGGENMESTRGRGELVTRGETRYLVQTLDDGTVCDLTGKPRRIEVQFHCNQQPPDRISLIKETSTCAYLMVIHTPRLCNDVAFLPPQKAKQNEILCSPVLAPEEIEIYERELRARDAALRDSAGIGDADAETATAAGMTGQAPTTQQMVGDIAIGAHKLVPRGTTIEKSAIVGGGKETYVDTVADSMGKLLSREELERLGLDDPKLVEKLRLELERVAAGARWKLDVIDTPRGREYRGIIGDEGEGEEEGWEEEEEREKEEQGGSQEEGFKEAL